MSRLEPRMGLDKHLQEAQSRARTLRFEPPLDAALERLRTDCIGLFAKMPEPPLYRRVDDPVRAQAEQLLPEAVALYARCLALGREAAFADAVEPLAAAVRANLEALELTVEGRLLTAERTWERANRLEEAAVTGRRLFTRSDATTAKVYDREKKVSRFDPRADATVALKLCCPRGGCHQVGVFECGAGLGPQDLTCGACGKPFHVYLGEVREAKSAPSGSARRHTFILMSARSGRTRIELTDASGAELSVTRPDLMAFLYVPKKELKGVLNLSSGRILWVQSGGPCFLVSAVFEEGAAELEVFRRFRDRTLLSSMLGRAAVRVYYALGPSLAGPVRRWPLLRGTVRFILRTLAR